MSDLHIGSVDLNLLVVLDALLRERNVTPGRLPRRDHPERRQPRARAPARSHRRRAPRRGRDGMVPTVRAEALAAPVARAAREIGRALAPPLPFDPRTARGKIFLGTATTARSSFSRASWRDSRGSAGIDLRALVLPNDMNDPVLAGTVDLVIAPLRPVDERSGIYAKKLFDEKFVCVVRRGHPLAKKKLTLARFIAASHALISPRGDEGGFVDDSLARLGMRRRVAVAVPHFLVAPHLVATSDLVLTLAARIAKVLAQPLRLAVLSPPPELGLERFTMSAVWHQRTHGDPMHRWFRELIASEAAAI